MKIQAIIEGIRAQASLVDRYASRSERQLAMASATAFGLFLGGASGIVTHYLEPGLSLTVGALSSVVAMPTCALVCSLLWKRRLRATFPAGALSELIDVAEHYRDEFEIHARMIRNMRLPPEATEKLLINEYQTYVERKRQLSLKLAREVEQPPIVRVSRPGLAMSFPPRLMTE